MPEVDLAETDDAYLVHLSLPGMKKEDIHVAVDNQVLTISGERKFVKENKKYHSIESGYGSFSRSFTLPENVNINKIDATFKEGILEITVPKDEKKALNKKSQIK